MQLTKLISVVVVAFPILASAADIVVFKGVDFPKPNKPGETTDGFVLRTGRVTRQQDNPNIPSAVDDEDGGLTELDGVTIKAKQGFQVDHILSVAMIDKQIKRHPALKQALSKMTLKERGEFMNDLRGVTNGDANLEQIPSKVNRGKEEVEDGWDRDADVKATAALTDEIYQKIVALLNKQKPAMIANSKSVQAVLQKLVKTPLTPFTDLINSLYTFVDRQEKIFGSAEVAGPVPIGREPSRSPSPKTKEEREKAAKLAEEVDAKDGDGNPITDPTKKKRPDAGKHKLSETSEKVGQPSSKKQEKEKERGRSRDRSGTTRAKSKSRSKSGTRSRRNLIPDHSSPSPVSRRMVKVRSMIRRELARL